jgi:hypothetical protein
MPGVTLIGWTIIPPTSLHLMSHFLLFTGQMPPQTNMPSNMPSFKIATKLTQRRKQSLSHAPNNQLPPAQIEKFVSPVRYYLKFNQVYLLIFLIQITFFFENDPNNMGFCGKTVSDANQIPWNSYPVAPFWIYSPTVAIAPPSFTPHLPLYGRRHGSLKPRHGILHLRCHGIPALPPPREPANRGNTPARYAAEPVDSRWDPSPPTVLASRRR